MRRSTLGRSVGVLTAADGRRSAQPSSPTDLESCLTVFDSIYAEHASAVYTSACWMGGPAAAEDITSRVFVDEWRHADPLDAVRTIDDADATREARKRLVVAVFREADARSHSAEPIRPLRRRDRLQRRWRRSDPPSLVSAGGDGLPPRGDLDELDWLAWIDRLDRRQRNVLALTLFGGCSRREIAGLVRTSDLDVAMCLHSTLRAVGEMAIETPPGPPPDDTERHERRRTTPNEGSTR